MLICVVAAAAALILVALTAFLIWAVNFSCKRGKKTTYEVKGEYAEQMQRGIDFYNSADKEFFTIRIRDDLSLSAAYIDNDKTDVVIILLHGYRSNVVYDFSGALELYHKLGFSILMPDQRSHGKSEGKYITYGIKERFDCVSWCEFAAEHFKNKRIILDGISMGATTVLMASAEHLPNNVLGIIADSGFTSPYDIIGKVAADMGYPKRLVMPVLRLGIRLLAGFDPKELSTTDALKKNNIPLLLVHGKADTFVPYQMTVESYNAANSRKRLVLTEKADHGLSFFVEHDRVLGELIDFFEECTGIEFKKLNYKQGEGGAAE